MTKTEASPLYRDGRHYDLINQGIVADIPFYRDEATRVAGPVLEVACGTGRLTIPIAERGVEIVGLDRSASMLAHARNKANVAGLKIEWVEADCRQFELGRKFGLIFMAFNSLQHLHERESLRAFFSNVHGHLAKGGRFIFDVFNPSITILARNSQKRNPLHEYEDPDGGERITLEENSVYDDAAQVNRIKWYFSRAGAKDFRVDALDMRCFFPQELDLLMEAHGFGIEAKFGSFERKEFASGDPKQIVVAGEASSLS
jgi:SAM-dependent methyltransferase